jgi:hypothetical protein
MARLSAYLAAIFLMTSPLAAMDAHLSEPVVHDNLAIYFVHETAGNDRGVSTLEEAVARGDVKIRETDNVTELTLANAGKDTVFIQAGDIVKGGRQDRVLSVDLVLPPRSGPTPIAAFCVEAGRWSARGAEDVKQFSSSDSSMPSHEAMAAMLSSSLPVFIGASQSKIWNSVDATQQNLGHSLNQSVRDRSSPSSLALSLESKALKEAQAAYVNALQNAGRSQGDIVGYVVAINGTIKSAQLYSSNMLFRKMWRKQLSASATEAIGKKGGPLAPLPIAPDVERLLTAAETGKASLRHPNTETHLTTIENDSSIYAETRTAERGRIHSSYLLK